MGVRRSTVKNKKSKRSASANAVERSTVARKAARKRSALSRGDGVPVSRRHPIAARRQPLRS